MALRMRAAALAVALGVTSAAVLADQNMVANGSMESGGGGLSEDPHIPADWIMFGGSTVERSDEANLVPEGPGHALKAFSGEPQVGAYQDVPVAPGDVVFISASLLTRASDKLSGDALARIALEFYDDGDQQVGFDITAVLDAGSPADTWVFGSLGPTAAPANTAYARMTCVWTWNGAATGSAFWDDCVLTINDSANMLANSDFEIAGVGEQSPFGIDEWTGFNDQERTEDAAWHGAASLKLGTAASYSGLFQNMGVLDAGDHIYLIARAMTPSSDPINGTTRVGIKLEFHPTGAVPPAEENLPFDQTAPLDTWQLVELNTIVPEDMTIARVVCLYAGTPDTEGAVHFDSVSAIRGSVPGNQLLNESFEDGSGGFQGLDHWFEFNTPGVSWAQKSTFEIVALEGWSTMKARGQAFAGVYQEIEVTPGETLDITAHLHNPSAEPLTGGAVAGLKVEWSPGSVPDDIDIGGADNTIDAGAAQDVWHELVIDYTMPAGTQAIAQFTNLIEKGTATTGTVYIDACEAVVFNRFDGADADGDDDADLKDYAFFQACFSGSGGTPLGWPCIVFDSDDDEDIDLADFTAFENGITGPVQ